MSAKHTPGPWSIHPHNAAVVPLAHVTRPIGGAEDADYDLAHYAQEICLMHWPDRHRTEAEVKANARLIAAAPDLLRVAELLVDWLHEEPGAHKLCDTARAAIAKARGDQVQ